MPRKSSVRAISDEEIQLRREFLEIGEEDIRRLQDLHGISDDFVDKIIEDLYQHMFSFAEARHFFASDGQIKRVKKMQKEYFQTLTKGEYGREYVENRQQVGITHERIGLATKWYLGSYRRYIEAVMKHVSRAVKGKPEEVLSFSGSLLKIIFFDMILAIDAYIERREETIRRQEEALRELPTPVLQIRDRLLLVPIVGLLDSHRARRLTEELLYGIRESRAKVVVIDITGVSNIDTQVANHLILAMEAARLLGANVVVSGISPEIAQTVVKLGVDLSRIKTFATLQDAVEEAEHILIRKVLDREN